MVQLPGSTRAELAATVGPLVRASGGTVRAAVDELAKGGYSAVQLDATLSGIRPRDLAERARRDLGATVARAGLRVAGVDFFIDRAHYGSAEHVDRAVASAIAAIELAADLGRVPLSLALPVASLSAEVTSALVNAADGRSVPLAVHAEDQVDRLLKWLAAVDLPICAAGLDPAAALAAGVDPAAVAHRLGRRLAVARLDDWTGGASAADAARCPVGEGQLDLLPYRVAVELAQGRVGPAVVDLRGLSQPLSAARTAKERWQAVRPLA